MDFYTSWEQVVDFQYSLCEGIWITTYAAIIADIIYTVWYAYGVNIEGMV